MMPNLKSFLRRLQTLWRSEQLHREIAEEMRFHVDQRTADNIHRGMPAAEARKEAEQRFGGMARIQEQAYELRSVGWVESFVQDVVYGSRLLRRTPGFTFAAVLTLALGIGSSTAMFSILYSVLLRPLPFPQPEKLISLAEKHVSGASRGPVSAANFYDWRDQSGAFSGLAAYASWSLNMTGTDIPERLKGALVSPELFDVLGVLPVRGRSFMPDEDQTGKSDVAVVSSKLWDRVFGPNAQLHGQSVLLNGNRTSIIGIMPSDFAFPSREIEIWVPLSLSAKNRENREGKWLNVIGRINPGATVAQLRDSMNVIARRLQQSYPSTNAGWSVDVVPLHENQTGGLRSRIQTLFAAVTLLLLIACSNVAGLWLTRGIRRSREFAIRAAIGAGRSRIVRQLLTESLLLGLAAGTCGLAFGYWVIQIVRGTILNTLPATTDIVMNGRVLAFGLMLSLATVVVFGMVPALRVSQVNLQHCLKSGGQTVPGSRLTGRRLLVVFQVALSFVLLAGAGLLTKSLVRLVSVNPGFDTHQMLTMEMNLPRARYRTSAEHSVFLQHVLERVRQLPGVERASAVSDLPLRGNSMTFKVLEQVAQRTTAGLLPDAGVRWVSDDYFTTMRIPLLSGRLFDKHDAADAPLAAIVNRTMAKYLGARAVDGTAKVRLEEDPRWFSIVGVVDDIKQIGLDTGEVPAIYFPHAQKSEDWLTWMTLVVRTSVKPEDEVNAIRAQIWAVDKDQAVSNVATLDQYLSESVAIPKLSSQVVAGFSLAALTISLVGLYGVVAYSVSHRKQEIGLRIALGASHASVLRMVLADGAGLAMSGIVLGLLGALMATRLIKSLLFAVDAADIATFFTVSLLLAVVAFLAILAPARNASRVDPMVTLRYE
jgi:putative ABC transport system permease protein